MKKVEFGPNEGKSVESKGNGLTEVAPPLSSATPSGIGPAGVAGLSSGGEIWTG